MYMVHMYRIEITQVLGLFTQWRGPGVSQWCKVFATVLNKQRGYSEREERESVCCFHAIEVGLYACVWRDNSCMYGTVIRITVDC